MKSKILNYRLFILIGIIAAAMFARLIPHPPNFTPIAAIALFGGAYFSSKKLAFIIPFAALFLSDLIIGFYSNMWAVYLSFALIVVIGFGLKNKKKITSIMFASVSASVLFFIITNFAVWLTGTMYPKSIEGLAGCFAAAIPFFHYTLFGDLFFVGLMFGIFEIAKAKYPALAKI